MALQGEAHADTAQRNPVPTRFALWGPAFPDSRRACCLARPTEGSTRMSHPCHAHLVSCEDQGWEPPRGASHTYATTAPSVQTSRPHTSSSGRLSGIASRAALNTCTHGPHVRTVGKVNSYRAGSARPRSPPHRSCTGFPALLEVPAPQPLLGSWAAAPVLGAGRGEARPQHTQPLRIPHTAREGVSVHTPALRCHRPQSQILPHMVQVQSIF